MAPTRRVSTVIGISNTFLHSVRIAKGPLLPIILTRSNSSQATVLKPRPQAFEEYARPARERPQTKKAPLSVLSTGALIRSTFICAVSSYPILLTPTLKVLSFLCKPIGGIALDVDKNPILHRILKTTFYDQFCAGENPAEARGTIGRLKDFGFKGVILTYAKETLYDYRTHTAHLHSSDDLAGVSITSATVDKIDPEIQSWKEGVLKTSSLLGKDDIVAIKLTGAGKNVTTAFEAGKLPPQQMLDALEAICNDCKEKGTNVIVDAESQHYQHAIDDTVLYLMRKFNQDGNAVVFNTYQAYLKGTQATVNKHLVAASKEGWTMGLKVVRGAYLLSDPRRLIHDTKEDTDNAYDNIAHGALKQVFGDVGGNKPNALPFPSTKLLLCSHNRKSLFSALELHQQRVKDNLPTVPVGFGQLHGMSDLVSFSLLQAKSEGQAGPEVFKCSTWGTMGECLAYLLRRAVENKSAVMRTTDEYVALKNECWRRAKGAILGSYGK